MHSIEDSRTKRNLLRIIASFWPKLTSPRNLMLCVSRLSDGSKTSNTFRNLSPS